MASKAYKDWNGQFGKSNGGRLSSEEFEEEVNDLVNDAVDVDFGAGICSWCADVVCPVKRLQRRSFGFARELGGIENFDEERG